MIDMDGKDECLESIAAIQHDIWSHWMKYLFSVSAANPDGSVTIPANNVERWRSQMRTEYKDLSHAEQQSDREQAEKVMSVLCVSNDLPA